MFNKIYNMQKLLLQNSMLPLGSANANIFAAQKYTNTDNFFAKALLAISLLYMFTIDSSMIFIPLITCTTLVLRGFISYNSDIISLIPVSKKFIFFNLNLIGFVFSLIFYLVYIVITYIFFGFIFLTAFIFTGGHISSSPDNTSNVLGLEASILFLLILLVYYFIMLAIMFIKNSKINLCAAITFSIVYFIFLQIFKAKINSYPGTTAAHDMLFKFQLIPNKLEILRTYSIATAVIIIFSITISYHLYNRKAH